VSESEPACPECGWESGVHEWDCSLASWNTTGRPWADSDEASLEDHIARTQEETLP
jgi:hypothetical protein